MIFLVFDAIRVRGETLVSRPFRERHARATSAVRLASELREATDVEERALETDTIVLVHYSPPLEMRAKQFIALEHAARLWRERGDARHRVDGLILQAEDAAYCVGTARDGSCLKWKDHSTIDLRGSPGDLHVAEGPLPTHILDRKVVVVPSRIVAARSEILEYSVAVTEDEVRIMAIRARPDKAGANGLEVVRATVTDVLDRILPDELVESVCGDRA